MKINRFAFFSCSRRGGEGGIAPEPYPFFLSCTVRTGGRGGGRKFHERTVLLTPRTCTVNSIRKEFGKNSNLITHTISLSKVGFGDSNSRDSCQNVMRKISFGATLSTDLRTLSSAERLSSRIAYREMRLRHYPKNKKKSEKARTKSFNDNNLARVPNLSRLFFFFRRHCRLLLSPQ